MKSKNVILLLCALVLIPFGLFAQEVKLDFSTENWLKDAATIKFGEKACDRTYFSGVRITLEPTYGSINQDGRNKFDVDSFTSAFTGLGAETNIYKGIASIQVSLISPFKVEFDENSPIKDKILNGENKLSVKYGFTGGFSFLDGMFSLGVGIVYYDKKELINPSPSDSRDGFFYTKGNIFALLRKFAKMQ